MRGKFPLFLLNNVKCIWYDVFIDKSEIGCKETTYENKIYGEIGFGNESTSNK